MRTIFDQLDEWSGPGPFWRVGIAGQHPFFDPSGQTLWVRGSVSFGATRELTRLGDTTAVSLFSLQLALLYASKRIDDKVGFQAGIRFTRHCLTDLVMASSDFGGAGADAFGFELALDLGGYLETGAAANWLKAYGSVDLQTPLPRDWELVDEFFVRTGIRTPPAVWAVAAAGFVATAVLLGNQVSPSGVSGGFIAVGF